MNVLVVVGERLVAHGLKRGLERDGFTTDVAFTGNDGLELARNKRYEAIILDTTVAGRNGYEVCAALRDAGVWTPIVMLAAKDGQPGHGDALDGGADDLLTKPFSYAVVAAHVRALIRRGSHERHTVLTAGDLRLDPAEHKCWRGETEIELTPRQFLLLEYMMRRPGVVMSKREIVEHVWDFGFGGDLNIVEVYIGYLRKKIDTPFARRSIQTIRLVGYRLDPDGGLPPQPVAHMVERRASTGSSAAALSEG